MPFTREVVSKNENESFFENKTRPCEAMLHPDTLLLKRVVCFEKEKTRTGNASPAGATLGPEPKLFYPKVDF